MRVLCVIDSLGSGGAQRQMVNLACGLKANGHLVEILVYQPRHDHFLPYLRHAGIPVHRVSKPNGFSPRVPLAIARLLRTGRFDTIVSFLHSSNIYAIIARLICCGPVRLLVSERSSYLANKQPLGTLIRYACYICASVVVANSESHSRYLRGYPWLRSKVRTVRNGYDLGQFNHVRCMQSARPLTFLVVGRISAVKNGETLVKALARFYRRNGYVPKVNWAGRQDQDAASLRSRNRVDEYLREHPHIAGAWRWLDVRQDVPQLLAECHALLHVSLYEGLPNAICEAFIAGRPVIASAVCDHPLLVEDGVRGFLCDPQCPESICLAMERFAALSGDLQAHMGCEARRYAEEHLSLNQMVTGFEKAILGA